MAIRTMVLHAPHAGTTQWFQGLLGLLTDLGADLDPVGMWYPPVKDGLPEDQQAMIESTFAAFGLSDADPYRSVIMRYAKVGIEIAIHTDSQIQYSWRAVGTTKWTTWTAALSNKDVELKVDTGEGTLTIKAGSSTYTRSIASGKRCSFVVTPANVTRTISGLATTLTLSPGTKEISYYGGVGVHTVTVSAEGYEDIQASVNVEEPGYSFNLAPLEGTSRVVHLTADRENATVDVADLTLALPAYVAVPMGEVELTATAGGQTVTDLIPADATFWKFNFGGGLPDDDVPPPTDSGNMMVRVVGLIDGTVTYDNDGFFNDPNPVELTGGYVDIEVPPPAVGCTGGVVSLTNPSFGTFQHRVVFRAGESVLVHLGPMRVTVEADGPFEVYFDEFSAFTWLPGDGVSKGVGSADRSVTFLTGVGGYVNVIPQGTAKVIRTPVDFSPARECLLSLELGLAPGEADGPDLPFSLGGAIPGAIAGALAGAAAGLLTSR